MVIIISIYTFVWFFLSSVYIFIKDPSSLNFPGSISPYSAILEPSLPILMLLVKEALLPFTGSSSLYNINIIIIYNYIKNIN